MKTSPVLLEIFQNRFTSIAEEMGIALQRSAFSPNIKERRDFSCALFDRNGDMVAQAAHVPVHLGSMPMSVQYVISMTAWERGDMVMLNDPYKGGTHLPDITLVAPVFIDGRPEFYLANRAHHADVGGISPGSMPLSNSIFQEGIIIPPLKIIEKGDIDRKILDFFLSNTRTPDEREGDLEAQIMANRTGIKRTEELISRYSLESVSRYAKALMLYSEHIMRQTIRDIPDGEYLFEDWLDDDGIENRNIKIHVCITINDDEATLDFSESASQVKGSVNAVHAITLSAVLYVFRSLVTANIPTNAGISRPLKVITRKGTVVDADFPSAVAGGNVETSQRIVDVILGALSKAFPGIIPAASQGTMNNITIGGTDPRSNKPFAYYETIGGGTGASASGHGESGIHSHMTNTMNTPIEALEYSYPFLVTEYSIRKNSGGEGLFNGGHGICRNIQLLSGAEVTVLSERRTNPPYGMDGGCSGKPGRNIVIKDGESMEKPGKFSMTLGKGDSICINTPGGGGYGKSS